MSKLTTPFRILSILIILILFSLPVVATGQETTLTTFVPTIHSLEIVIRGKGVVSIDGKEYSKSTDIQISRQTSPIIEIKSATNYAIDYIKLNDENITKQFKGGKWTFPPMIDDGVLEVKFEPLSDIPATGDTSHICLWFILMLLSLTGLIMCYLSYRKRESKCG